MGKLWNFAQFGDSPALIGDTGVTLTYRDLAALSETVEAAVGQADSGALVMFVCRNTLGALSGYAALINRGHPVLPVSAELPADMRRDLMNVYRPGTTYCSEPTTRSATRCIRSSAC